MKNLNLLFSTLLAVSSAAHAASPEPMLVKKLSCASGELDASKTIFTPETLTTMGYIHILVGESKGTANLLETNHDAVLSIVVSGNNDGVCKNNDIQTVLTVTIGK